MLLPEYCFSFNRERQLELHRQRKHEAGAWACKG